MVAGDPVVSVGAAVGTIHSFQPAATVVVLICTCGGNVGMVQITNGVIGSIVGTTANGTLQQGVTKTFVDNTWYISTAAVGGWTNSFTGIQIK